MRLPTRLLALLMLLPVLTSPTAAAPAAARDWSKVAVRKPDGAFVQGNPAAKVKLVEYLSMTCPHCAKLEGEAIVPLTAKYVRTGLVSYEVRHALRDPFDFAASLLARCNGPLPAFSAIPAVYAQQTIWFDRAVKWSQTAPADIPPDKVLPSVAAGAGLDTFFAAHGVPPAKAQACLADKAEQKLLSAMADEAWKRPGFPGTPAFLINGTQQDGIVTWADLDAKLAAALK